MGFRQDLIERQPTLVVPHYVFFQVYYKNEHALRKYKNSNPRKVKL